jgi:hypothetical protein
MRPFERDAGASTPRSTAYAPGSARAPVTRTVGSARRAVPAGLVAAHQRRQRTKSVAGAGKINRTLLPLVGSWRRDRPAEALGSLYATLDGADLAAIECPVRSGAATG